MCDQLGHGGPNMRKIPDIGVKIDPFVGCKFMKTLGSVVGKD